MRRGCCFNRACFAGRERAIERLRGPAVSGRRAGDCHGRLWVCDTHGSAPATWERGTSIRRYILRLLGSLLSKRRPVCGTPSAPQSPQAECARSASPVHVTESIKPTRGRRKRQADAVDKPAPSPPAKRTRRMTEKGLAFKEDSNVKKRKQA